ncbi:hypothetical protein ACN2XU_01745 [Primorskyibacter sp. 2E107]|uniref:hypothetical protein n=1 Tax=Primorskyibacter sp. 2E107 TaxID=3403458 RepID=UPI003AF6058E
MHRGQGTGQTAPHPDRAPAERVELHFGSLPSGAAYIQLKPGETIDKQAVVAVHERVAETPGLNLRMPTLWDFRGFDFETYDLGRCRREAPGCMARPERLGALRAFVVDSEVGYGIMRMLQEVVAGHGAEDMDNLYVTYAFDDALGWMDNRLRH